MPCASRVNPALPPGLSIIHANRAEDLRELLVDWMRRYPLAPLENELILVQSNGMAQWLNLRLAADDACGIAAGLSMQMPARFLWQAYRAFLGEAHIPEASPFDKAPLTWRLMQLLPRCLPLDGFEPLRDYLQQHPQQTGEPQAAGDLHKRFQLAQRLADLYDQYQVYRADWLAHWQAGSDHWLDHTGQPQALPDDQRWQPMLWRALRRDLPADQPSGSRADIHQAFIQACQQAAVAPPTLPRRILVFGVSSLPQQALEALNALSRFAQVQIYVLNPCRYFWADIIEGRQLLRFQQARHPARAGLAALDEASLHHQVNPLLAAWGRQGRDYIGLLYQYDTLHAGQAQVDVFSDWVVGWETDRAEPAQTKAETETETPLLHQIQQAILDLAAPPRPKRPIGTGDHSVQFHLAHSRQREVEILQDQLLDRLCLSPALRPRDIIVMVPDIAAYAPHIDAVFGQIDRDDPRYVPYTIADRPARMEQPLVAALSFLLQLPDSRFRMGELLDLLEIAAFRDRFDIAETDLPGLTRWLQDSGIRWGLDAGQRASHQLPADLQQNTWQFGLNRLLLGYATGRPANPWQSDWCGIEPYSELSGLEAALIGRLVQAIEALARCCQQLRLPASPADWAQRLQQLLQTLLKPQNDAEQLLLENFNNTLSQWLEDCERANFDAPVPLSIVRQTLLGSFDAGSLSQSFLVGSVNFCTLMPMRAIPFRIVCLLGMNDGDYPRQQPPMDFDLMANGWRPGDRSRREDDRYLFLEALLSARDQLYISGIGFDQRDNSSKPLSVLVGQLRDHIASGWCGQTADLPLLDQLTWEHPLQPFSKRYFQPSESGKATGKPFFTYAQEWRQAYDARQTYTSATQHTPALPPIPPGAPLTPEQIGRFLRQPADVFFKERLGVSIRAAAAVEDDEPFLPDKLQQHQFRTQLLEPLMRAQDDINPEAHLDASLQRLRATGQLPIGAQAEQISQTLRESVMQTLQHWHTACARWNDLLPPLELQFAAPELAVPEQTAPASATGWQLEGWLTGLRRNSAGQIARLTWHASPALKGKDFKYHYGFALWAQHLCACACGHPLTSLLISSSGIHGFAPTPQADAAAQLSNLIRHYRDGLQAPLAVAAKTAFVWLDWREKQLASDRDGEQMDPASITYDAKTLAAYEGLDYPVAGFIPELQQSFALRRLWPNFHALWEAGFADAALRLYAPLHAALKNYTSENQTSENYTLESDGEGTA